MRYPQRILTLKSNPENNKTKLASKFCLFCIGWFSHLFILVYSRVARIYVCSPVLPDFRLMFSINDISPIYAAEPFMISENNKL